MNVFRRRELKFLINEDKRQIIEEILRQRMVPDHHGMSTICNLYYDTPDYRLIRRSLEHPIYKEKMRLRSYGPIKPGTDVFLELKKKYKGVVYKRRIRVGEEEAQEFITYRSPLHVENQISREMAYFRDFYVTLQPRIYICYDRLAWYDPHDSGFRVTLDRNIRYRTDQLTLISEPSGIMLLEPGESLMEVKAEGGIPMWMTELLSANNIHKRSFSKYGRAYEQLLSKKLVMQRG
jgi:SPX domain protein involved in polyphosphate accumulation